MALANPAFAALVSRLPRRRFIPLAYRFFAINMVAFFLAFRFLPRHGGVALGYAFYIWLSVFNLFVVSVFWGLMSDVWCRNCCSLKTRSPRLSWVAWHPHTA